MSPPPAPCTCMARGTGPIPPVLRPPQAKVGTGTRWLTTTSTMPYSRAPSAVSTRSRSVSCRSRSTVCPVCADRIDSICRADPDHLVGLQDQVGDGAPALRGRLVQHDPACGSTARRPGSPAASSTAPAAIAWPTHVVATGAWMNCMVS